MRKIRVSAIFAGLAVDFIGSVLFVIAVMVLGRALGKPADAAFAFVFNVERHVSWLLAAYWIGVAFTLLGAYVTARLSRPNCVLNTLIFGIISTLPAVISFFTSPLWYTLLCVVTITPWSVAVGYVVERSRPNQALQPTAGQEENYEDEIRK